MPQIRVKNGPCKGRTCQIGGTPVTIGRDPSCTLQIIDKGVSRNHAEIYRVGEMYFIRDVGSRNGTFVNDDQIQEELLREGDIVRIGGTTLVFESEREVEGPQAVTYADSEEYKTSLEMKVDDLFAFEGQISESGNFKAICQAAQIMQAERDEKRLCNRILELIQEYVPADNIYLFLKDEATGNVVPKAMLERNPGSGGVPVSRTILKRVFAESAAILTADAMADDRFKTGDSIVMNQIRAVLCVPMVNPHGVTGAIYCVNCSMADTFEESDMQFVSALGAHLALALENLAGSRARRAMLLGLMSLTINIMEGLPPDALGHGRRVSQHAAAISDEMHLGEGDRRNLMLAALLHDIGSYIRPQDLKADNLSGLASPPSLPKNPPGSGELPWDRLPDQGHVLRGCEALKKIKGAEGLIPAIRSHHERMDGKGYPDGLKGDAIPMYARILAVANAFDRLVYGYAGGDTPGNVRQSLIEMGNSAGAIFDTNVVRSLIVAYRNGKLAVPRKDTTRVRLEPPS